MWTVGTVSVGSAPGEKCRLHDLAQPNHGPFERFARRVRSRKAFDGRELPVAVSEFGASDDQPSITVASRP